MNNEDIERFDNDLFRASDGKWIKFSDHEYAVQQLAERIVQAEYFRDLERESQAPLKQRAEKAERELAATIKAKQENDERFMIERDEARAQLATAREDSARLDWLAGEMDREQELLKTQTEAMIPLSLFRRNEPITRAAIDAARNSEGEK